jgi:predicted DNA-binding transcriptional regulator AlpA
MEMKMTTQAQPFGFDRTDGAAHLGLSVSSFDRLVASGMLPAGRMLGGAKRWVRTELERALIEAPADVPPGAVRRTEAADKAAGANPWDLALDASGPRA